VTISQTAPRPRWLRLGLAAIALGLVALVAGGALLTLRDTGWPWHASISDSTAAGVTVSTAQVVDEDGQVYNFTGGSAAEAQAWLAHTEDGLKQSHGIYTKITVGKALAAAGMLLVAVGIGLLPWSAAWRRVSRRRRLA
jgi:hypothetical protein